MSIEKPNTFESSDNKLDKSKEKILYPEKLENLAPIDGTENKTISFAREGGKSRWYPMEDGNEGDGDSLYTKISKEEGNEFYLIDGKDINDVGNFVVGFFNNVNEEVEVNGEKYPMAVYLKRRDRISPHKTDNISDVDVMRDEAYKFCFYDKDINGFINTTMDSDSVSRGETKNWAEVKQKEDNLIIDYPTYGVYNDGYKVGEKGGAKSFNISELISQGKIEKARELMSEGNSEKAKLLAETAVQITMNKGIKADYKFERLIYICQEFGLKEVSDITNKYIDKLMKEDLSRVDSSRIDEKLSSMRYIFARYGKNESEQDFETYKYKVFNEYINRSCYRGDLRKVFKLVNEYNIDIDSPQIKSKLNSLAEHNIELIVERKGSESDVPLDYIQDLLKNGIDLQVIKKEIDVDIKKTSQDGNFYLYLIESKLRSKCYTNFHAREPKNNSEKVKWLEMDRISIKETLDTLKKLGQRGNKRSYRK